MIGRGTKGRSPEWASLPKGEPGRSLLVIIRAFGNSYKGAQSASEVILVLGSAPAASGAELAREGAWGWQLALLPHTPTQDPGPAGPSPPPHSDHRTVEEKGEREPPGLVVSTGFGVSGFDSCSDVLGHIPRPNSQRRRQP